MADPPTGAGDPWATRVEAFVDRHYGSLRGRVRTDVIDTHLRDHLPPPPGPLVDIGGGAGNQALPLARRGYEVTIADPSAAMLERARQALDDEQAGVAANITLVQVDGACAVARLGAERFAAVLCHGVIPYVDRPHELVAALSALCQPGGVVSIVAKNAATMASRLALEGRWHDALHSFDAAGEINALGLHTRADTVDGLGSLLRDHGVDPVTWYGVRLFVEMWAHDRTVDPADEATVYAVELEASRRDPYRQLSRLFHLVGTKRHE